MLNVSNNAKTVKGDKLGEYLTGVLYLSPADKSGVNLCRFARECKGPCLDTAGRGVMSPVQAGRLRKSRLFLENRPAFFAELCKAIEALERKAKRENMLPAVRLNGTSDIRFERIKFDGATIMERYPRVQFYDYTKYPISMLGTLPANYDITFSHQASNLEHSLEALDAGINVAVCFRDDLPETYLGFPVINGDKHDLRFTDPRTRIVGLKAKGKARHDVGGFTQ